jgi:chemotaxis protein MotB
MSRKKRHPAHANHERWLVSYADFITLLFAFFVVLYASSQVDKRKVGRLALAIQVAFQEMGVFQASNTEAPIDVTDPMPFSTVQAVENRERTAGLAQIASRPDGSPTTGVENGDLAQLQAELQKTLSAEIKRKEIALHREPDGLVISLREVGFFESGSARMKSASQAAFDRIANLLRPRGYRLRIEGHTDNVPIHTSQFPSNWELSTSRSTEIVRLLIVRDGFAPNRMSAAGYAEYHPVAPNLTAEGRGMNRRVDIVILGHAVTTAPIAQGEAQTQMPVQVPAANTSATSGPAAALKPTVARAASGHLQQ